MKPGKMKLNRSLDWVTAILTVVLLSAFLILGYAAEADHHLFLETCFYLLLGVWCIATFIEPDCTIVTRSIKWVCLHFMFPPRIWMALAIGIVFLGYGLFGLYRWINISI